MTSNDEQHGRAVLAPLSDLGDPPPPTYNLSAAVGTGRRRRRRRRIATVAGIAAVTALAVAAAPTALATFREGNQENVAASPSTTPLAPALPTSCELQPLPEPDGMYASVTKAMDPTGRFIAGYANSRVNGNMVSTPVLWRDGRPQLVGPRGLNVEISDVNSQGVAVATTVPGEPAAWIYRDGKLSRLGERSLAAHAINERGDVVGVTGDNGRPFVIRHGRGEPVELPLPPGATGGGAFDIDEDGTIVGTVVDPKGRYTYVWLPDGKGVRAPMTDPGHATEIRNGWVVSFYRDKGSRWNVRTGAVRTFPQLIVSGGVNRHGWVAGRNRTGDAVLVSDTGELVLPGIVRNGSLVRDAAVAVADDGRTVAGHVTGNDNEGHAAVWRCS